jgi:acyl-CoA synthetase (AMP-forming)/AMP-acid ligase II
MSQILLKEIAYLCAWLQQSSPKDEPVLLLVKTHREYIPAMLACLFSGRPSVTMAVPKPNRSVASISHILKNSGSKSIIVSDGLLEKLDFVPETPVSILEFNPDCISEESFSPVLESLTSPVFIQYSSGTTGMPKGVPVSEEMLLANLKMIDDFHGKKDHVTVSWLPWYHDMGLVGTVFYPLMYCSLQVFLSPFSFIKKPVRWLEAISLYQARFSGGPNFAYERCTALIKEEQMEGVDLSSWDVAFNGAEPVQLSTLEQFSEKFKRWGFRQESFCPCYGMAENTLVVSSSVSGDPVKTVEREETSAIVSCGVPHPDMQVSIMKNGNCVPEGEEGEILLRGKSLFSGYWNMNDRESFVQWDGSDWYCTGDSGFLMNGELYVTGRVRDLIIISGVNYYPEQIEHAVEQNHFEVRDLGCFAIAKKEENETRLILLVEISQEILRQWHNEGELSNNFTDLKKRIAASMGEVCEAGVYRQIFVKAGSLPKTTSGKKRRREALNQLVQMTLQEVE